jgi:hypothetical protein
MCHCVTSRPYTSAPALVNPCLFEWLCLDDFRRPWDEKPENGTREILLSSESMPSFQTLEDLENSANIDST